MKLQAESGKLGRSSCLTAGKEAQKQISEPFVLYIC